MCINYHTIYYDNSLFIHTHIHKQSKKRSTRTEADDNLTSLFKLCLEFHLLITHSLIRSFTFHRRNFALKNTHAHDKQNRGTRHTTAIAKDDNLKKKNQLIIMRGSTYVEEFFQFLVKSLQRLILQILFLTKTADRLHAHIRTQASFYVIAILLF